MALCGLTAAKLFLRRNAVKKYSDYASGKILFTYKKIIANAFLFWFIENRDCGYASDLVSKSTVSGKQE